MPRFSARGRQSSHVPTRQVRPRAAAVARAAGQAKGSRPLRRAADQVAAACRSPVSASPPAGQIGDAPRRAARRRKRRPGKRPEGDVTGAIEGGRHSRTAGRYGLKPPQPGTLEDHRPADDAADDADRRRPVAAAAGMPAGQTPRPASSPSPRSRARRRPRPPPPRRRCRASGSCCCPGFASTFLDAMRRAAQIASAYKAANVFCFTWPANGKVNLDDYQADRVDAEKSGQAIADALAQFLATSRRCRQRSGRRSTSSATPWARSRSGPRSRRSGARIRA